MRTNTNYYGGADTTSLDEIISAKLVGTELSVSSDSTLFSDFYLQTAFAGFYISNIVDTVVEFSFGLSTSFDSSNDRNVPFDIINVDTHNGWRSSSNAYVVKVPGVYVISFGLAAAEDQDPYLRLYAPTQITGLFMGSKAYRNGIEMLSRTVLIDIDEGHHIALVFTSNYGSVYSDIRCQTSLKGFLYKPHRNKPISWCVLWAPNSNLYITGPINPVSFNVVLVNQGSGWNSPSNLFVTPLSGVYYILLTAGIYEYKPTKMELLINGFPRINVYRQFTSHIFWDTRSRAVIQRLQQNDVLSVQLPHGYYLQSNGNGYTGFAGFRLYA